jgi:hypothetical protein
MSVYGRQRSADPFRNDRAFREYVTREMSRPGGVIEYTSAEQLAEINRIACGRRVREDREREGVVDLIEIDGLWQVPGAP